jgi:serine/threonine protein kinase
VPPTPRRFVFAHCLGRGSFGEVYAATMRSPGGLESPVAVKVLRADIDFEGEAVRRLRDEGWALAKLNHPAILKVFDLVTLRGRLALITELVDGADLADCLAPRLPARAALQALGHVASALDAASTARGPDGPLRLVHRDVKPSNVRLDRHGQAKLLDFGIARFDASDREVRTASDLVVGSVPYMAPERFIERAVDPSSDVFSLGCTLFEALAGERFYGTSQVAKITGLAMQPKLFEATAKERIGGLKAAAGVRQLLGDLLRVDPERRPSAAQVAARLEGLSDEIGGPTLRMWCRDRDWGAPRAVEGALAGQTLDEGELEAYRAPPRGGPVVNAAPRPTLEPGTASPWAPIDPSETLPGAVAPRAPEPPTASTEPVRPAVPVRSDSLWERPYTAEAARPSVPAPTPLAEPAVSSPHVAAGRSEPALEEAGRSGIRALALAVGGVGVLGAGILVGALAVSLVFALILWFT